MQKLTEKQGAGAPAGKRAGRLALALAAFSAAGLLFFAFYELFVPADPAGSHKALIDVPPGRGFDQTARELREKGLIRRELPMKLLARAFSPPLMAGEYRLSSGESLWRQFQKLKNGDVHYFSVTFAEGLNHYEIWEALKGAGWRETERFLPLVRDKKLIKELLGEELDSFEGYLFPETYAITKYMKAESLLRLMVREFFKAYQKAAPGAFRREPLSGWSQGSKAKLKQTGALPAAAMLESLSKKARWPAIKSRHEAVTFASLIEKETGAPEERPLISSVFHNRLRLGMKLQTDPTILYSLYLAKGFSHPKNIRKRDILFDSPYNTYVIKGLPPGPVANPGRESLRAVFFPESSDYLYFVSRNNGTHVFSKTLAEHEKAVYEYQIKPFRKKKR